MRKFKKLIPAFAMLLVSAIMLGSSTFAWFSMNNKVTADGMKVDAQANTQYFVISSNNTLGTLVSNTPTKTAGGISGNTGKVYPCSFAESAQSIDSTNDVAANSFYTCFSKEYNDPATGTTSTKRFNVKTLTAGAADYMFTYKVWVGLAANSATVSKKVKMTATITGGAALVVVFDSKTFTLKNTSETEDKSVTSDAISFEAGVGHEVVMYVYIDGENVNLKDQAEAAALTGTVKVEFDFVD